MSPKCTRAFRALSSIFFFAVLVAFCFYARTGWSAPNAPLSAWNQPSFGDSPVAARARVRAASSAQTLFLRRRLPARPFRIAAADARRMQAELLLSDDEFLMALLPIARDFAVAPISRYLVGEAARGASGDVYLGVNVEFPGHPLHQTIHGEQFLIARMLMHGERGAETLALPAAPCGVCRQFLWELGGAERVRIVMPGMPFFRVGELLPLAFGPQDLHVHGALLASAPRELRLLSRVARRDARLAALAESARHAATLAYAPYAAAAGIALRTASGREFTGMSIDNAGFNPSLMAIHVALTGMVAEGEPFASIREAVLVEESRPGKREDASSRALLATLAPRARWHYLSAAGSATAAR